MPYLSPQTKTTCLMFPYRQFRKKLAQIAKMLNQQRIEIVYIAVIQGITPHSPQTRKQTKNILLSTI
jgi:hypothetical protein